MATFIARAMGLASVAGDVFNDVSGIQEASINAVSQAGVTVGCNPEGTIFCPTESVLRDQMATFITRSRSLVPPVVTADIYYIVQSSPTVTPSGR